jgi:hypothetical protein
MHLLPFSVTYGGNVATSSRATGADAVPATLLIAWRRPHHTRRVLDALRVVRPERLFVAVDGPDEDARPGESAAVAATIDVIESSVDWPCTVSRRYSPSNQGCREGVSSAIDWFFGEAEEGVILEDDCVPHPEFFRFTAELLRRYRDDARVMSIAGDNSAGLRSSRSSSYTFVRYPQIWGWATWRRAWQRYDRDLAGYARARASGDWRRMVPDPAERAYFERVLDGILDAGTPDTWDYQWVATLLQHGGLSVHPRVNLVSNIGFGPEAVHTTNTQHRRADVPTESILPLGHPLRVRLDRSASRFVFSTTQSRQAPSTLVTRRVRQAISRILPPWVRRSLRSAWRTLQDGPPDKPSR